MSKKIKAFANINLGDSKKEVTEKLSENSQIKNKEKNTHQLKLFTKDYILKPEFADNKLEMIKLSYKNKFHELKEAKAENKLLAQFFKKEYNSATLRNQIVSYRAKPNWTHKWQLPDKEITLYIDSFTLGSVGHKFKSIIEISIPKTSNQKHIL